MDYTCDKARESIGGSSAGAGTAGPLTGGMAAERARQNACSEERESLRSRASAKAFKAAHDANRHQRLAEKLTPEIELAIWAFQECLALGLVDARPILEAAQRSNRLGLDGY